MKASKLREFSKEELKAKVSDLKRELLNLRFEAASTQIKNPLKKKEIRKNIARILTIIKEKK